MKDLEYQNRFVSCFMNHYNRQYELHVFTTLEQLEKIAPMEYAVIITGEYSIDEMANYVERGEILLALAEDDLKTDEVLPQNFIYTEKYQEVYKIVEMLERLVADKTQKQGSGGDGRTYIGVYSMTQGIYQAPFSALLGKICGEKQKVLVLDLQEYSGLNDMKEEPGVMGLEDLLSMSMTGNYSRGRILECIRHGANWDYVCSSQNVQSLAEGSQELYDTMLQWLVDELEYQKIIINFGTIFMGSLELMEQCQKIYLLEGKEQSGDWREAAFFEEVTRKKKDGLLKKIKKVEIPQVALRDNTWESLVENWSWSYIGEMLRLDQSKEMSYGEAV